MRRSISSSVIPALVLVAGCSAAEPPVPVAKVLAQCDSFRGKIARVAGYLGECAGYSCHLFPDAAAAKAFDDAWRAMGLAQREGGNNRENVKLREAWERINALWPMGVGWAEAFDRKAAPFQGSYVVITGRVVSGDCTGRGGTDRSPGIEPTDIRAWTAAEGAPAKSK
jgi:hypothetical protein